MLLREGGVVLRPWVTLVPRGRFRCGEGVHPPLQTNAGYCD